MPGLEGEGGAPHEPEVGLEERRIKLVRYAAPAEHAFRFQRETLNRQNVILAQAEFGRRLSFTATDQAGFGRRLHRLVPGENLLGNSSAFIERRDRSEEIVSAKVFTLDHPAAAQHIAGFRRAG